MKFKQFLLESPIIYDDEDINQQVNNIDTSSNTKWVKHPPINADIYEIEDWVNLTIEKGGLKDKILDSGGTKIVKFNDEKTVFKYNYDKFFGNQITNEIKIYQKYYNQYSDVLPKFYLWGKNWCIQEKLKPINRSEFTKITGIKYKIWDIIISSLSEIQTQKITIEELKKHSPKIEKILKDSWFNEIMIKYLYQILNSKILYKILEFCFKTKISILEMNTSNLGIDDQR